MLLIRRLMIPPALANMPQAGYHARLFTKNPETITVEFIDCTGVFP